MTPEKRKALIDTLVEKITEELRCSHDILVDALLFGRTGFNEMSDEELLGSAEDWDVEVEDV